jgi:hypothetical protein
MQEMCQSVMEMEIRVDFLIFHQSNEIVSKNLVSKIIPALTFADLHTLGIRQARQMKEARSMRVDI